MHGQGLMAGLSVFLERELAQRGWSQRKAAVRMDMPVQTLNDLLRNPQTEPDLGTLRKIAHGLEVTLGRVIQAMGDNTDGPQLPRPLRGLDAKRLAYIDGMDEEEFAAFLDAWHRIKHGA